MPNRTIRSIRNHFVHGDTLELRLEKEIIFVAMVVYIGTILLHNVEGWSYFDALYFCVITLTGVGYGDIVPVTITGKIITMVFAFIGLPLFVYTMSIVIEDRLKRAKK